MCTKPLDGRPSVDDLIRTVFVALDLGEVGRGLWEPALPHLVPALAGDDAAFLVSVENVARSAGLSQSAPVSVLLEAFNEGCRGLCDGLAAGSAVVEARRLRGLGHIALTRIATGYTMGLEETIDRMRRSAEDASPIDATTGAMKPEEITGQLSLEVDRCQRMDLSLGLLELAVDDAVKSNAAAPPGAAGDALPAVSECLRENLRRYDSIGLTQDGGFLLVLPDISRRGLAGAAERLRRELAACAVTPSLPEFVFALAHYDYVDVNAGEMLETLGHSMRQARQAHESIAWS